MQVKNEDKKTRKRMNERQKSRITAPSPRHRSSRAYFGNLLFMIEFIYENEFLKKIFTEI